MAPTVKAPGPANCLSLLGTDELFVDPSESCAASGVFLTIHAFRTYASNKQPVFDEWFQVPTWMLPK